MPAVFNSSWLLTLPKSAAVEEMTRLRALGAVYVVEAQADGNVRILSTHWPQGGDFILCGESLAAEMIEAGGVLCGVTEEDGPAGESSAEPIEVDAEPEIAGVARDENGKWPPIRWRAGRDEISAA